MEPLRLGLLLLLIVGCKHVRVEQVDEEHRTRILCGSRHASEDDLGAGAAESCKASAQPLRCWEHPYGTVGFSGENVSVSIEGTTKYGLCCEFQCQ